MLRAAILARKSTDDNDKNEDNKSVTRQVERGRAYISSKGWILDDVHVYVDDDVSGAEFKNRPGLLRLLNHLKEIDVIVMSEFSRLGREQSHTGTVLAKIHGAGARIFFYLTDEELRYESALDKFMAGAVSFAAELEREKASQRSRDALSRKALRAGAYRMLDVIVAHKEIGIDRRMLAEHVGMEVTGGTFTTYLGDLRRNGLAVEERGLLVATDILWPEGKA